MKEAILSAITKSEGRKFLYHFTRASNLEAIFYYDTLFSSYSLAPDDSGERRKQPEFVSDQQFTYTLNPHLSIPESMMAEGVTLAEFRICLNRHVFFWPTLSDCRKMMATYARREPEESFAVLMLDAYSLLDRNFAKAKLSKYDSGSCPRFPSRCSYKKSPAMLLPAAQFTQVINGTVPSKPSEIREVLVEGQVEGLAGYLRAVFTDSPAGTPERLAVLLKPYGDLEQVKR